eukprot:CAMPEP_0198203386 /NCGR_PEP_ID=MMETSP1445-20131203/6670_1 /TAXON_ID=36898 /ORGANISM="Pyramimonas sp., Strain CCMP2087" /LENGTH=307 /DNA_ID=CAMNT_0043874761 /DNA_START=237 /DNA_END=1161 /DNA_ORIENTATION=-
MFGGFGNLGAMFEELNRDVEHMFSGEIGRMPRGNRLRVGGIPEFSTPSPGAFRGGSGSSYSTSYTSSSSRGADGKTVQYSSTSRSSKQGGNPAVSETKRNFKDSTGFERIGISRTVGERGRKLVRTRDASGNETCDDNLLGVADGSAFDSEWERAATDARLNQLGRGPGLRAGSGPGLGYPPNPRPPENERRIAREGRQAYEQQHARIVDDARRVRAEGSAHGGDEETEVAIAMNPARPILMIQLARSPPSLTFGSLQWPRFPTRDEAKLRQVAPPRTGARTTDWLGRSQGKRSPGCGTADLANRTI